MRAERMRPVFLAAPERGDGSLSVIDNLLLQLQVATGGALKGSHVFVPHLQIGDVGIETQAAAYFSKSLAALQDAQVVVAVLDGPQVDESVAFWLGYAFAARKPVIGYRSDRRDTGPMVAGALAAVARDPRELARELAKVML
jgi:nucleoside 2-deoxyribosyltransferase